MSLDLGLRLSVGAQTIFSPHLYSNTHTHTHTHTHTSLEQKSPPPPRSLLPSDIPEYHFSVSGPALIP
jgi:hypothetical protein